VRQRSKDVNREIQIDAGEVWDLRPFEGAGPLRFGMTRHEVIDVLGEPDLVVADDPLLVEEHDVPRVQLGYDGADHLIALHLVDGHPFRYAGILPVGREVDEVRVLFERQGIRCDLVEDGIDLFNLGVHLYAPRHSDPDLSCVVQGVLFGTREYEAMHRATEKPSL
jgi:hypothetical protein